MNVVFEEIPAANLADWADRVESDRQLASLVRHLVLGSGAKIRECRFLTNEETNTSGWDGIVTAETEGLYVPAQNSRWELSKEKAVVAKAERDISERSANPGELQFSETTYVAVTPRRWPGRKIDGRKQSSGDYKKAWAEEKKAKYGWKDVRVIDAIDLAAWIAAVPGAAIWLAQLMGRRVTGATSLLAHWNELSTLRVGLIPEIFLAGRNVFSAALDMSIGGGPKAFEAQTWSHQDLKDAVSAWWAIKSQRSDWLIPLMPIAVQSLDAWTQLTKSNKPMLLFADEGMELRPEHISSAVAHGHHVIYRTTAGRSRADGGSLPPLSRDVLAEELQKSKLDSHEAWRMSSHAAGSGVALKRMLLGHSADPVWANSGTAREVAPVVLLGSWDGTLEGDRQRVEALFSKSYAEVEAMLLPHAQADDPLVRQIGKTWRVVGREDAWRWLAPHLEDKTLSMFREQANVVLSEINPRYDLPSDRRMFANITGDVPKHSSRLRRAIAETLCLVALRPPTEKKDEFVALARSIVDRVLAEGRDWKSWASLDYALVFLAEAVPDAFLSSIERDLKSASPATTALFSNGGDGLFGDVPHVDLMWALEGLLWQPQWVMRAITVLAKFAGSDPGGNTSPRPMGVLREVFLPWLPQTCLDIKQRCQALDQVMQVEPEVAWKLFLALLPKTHDVSSPTHIPSYLPSQTPSGKKINADEYWEQVRHVAKRLIELTQQRPEKWKALIREFHQLPTDALHAALAAISEVRASWTDEEKLRVWDSLRAFAADHRFYADANWRMPDNQLVKVEKLSREMEPVDPLRRNAWLFAGYSAHTAGTTTKTPQDQRKDLLKQERVRALNEVVKSGHLTALCEFALCINESGTAGALIAEENVLIDDTRILPAWLQNVEKKQVEFARGYFAARFFREGWSWFDALSPQAWGSDTLAQLAQVFPFNTETWSRFSNFDADFIDKYWLQVQPYPRLSTTADVEKAVTELISRGRAAAAIQLVDSTRFEKNVTVTVELALRAVEAVGKQPEPRKEQIDPYQASEVIRGIQDFETLTPDQTKRLATIEWNHLPFLKEHLEPKTLNRHVLSDPAFFVELLKARPWSDNSPPDTRPELSEEQRTRYENAEDLLDRLFRLPGQSDDHNLDFVVFTEWVHRARSLAVEAGYAQTCENRIGHLLLHSPIDPGGFWPCKPICRFLSEDSTDVTRDAFRVAIFNNQGWPGPHMSDGLLKSDMSEREKAVQILRSSAAQIEMEFPLVAEILRSVADEEERFIHHRPLRDDE
jgi:hypothetical protein